MYHSVSTGIFSIIVEPLGTDTSLILRILSNTDNVH